MLLLDVGIECRIAQVGLYTVITFKVASLNIVFGSPLTLACAIFCAIIVISIFASTCILSNKIHLVSLAKLVWVTHGLTVLSSYLLRATAHLLRHKAAKHAIIHAHHLSWLLECLPICTLCSTGESHLLHHVWIHHVRDLTPSHHVELVLHGECVVHLLLVRCGILLLVIVCLHDRIFFRIKPRLE